MIEKVKTMYDLIVEKFSASPYGRHQAQAYRKIRALADECDSVATMTARLQNEGYNKLPAIALMTDKIEAHYQAAIENGLEEHAAIYRRVLDDIHINPDNAYQTGFYDEVRQANERYAKTLERLIACFNDYLHFKVKNELPPNIEVALKEWKKERRSFSEVIYQKAFRSHFVCSDDFLESFVKEYESLTTVKTTESTIVEHSRFEEAFDAIKKDESRRLSTALIELPKYLRAAAMSIAPVSADDDYEYINIEFEN